MSLITFLLLIPISIYIWIFIETYREQKSPVDNSNRLNKKRLIWFGFTRQHIFEDYMTYDVNTFKGKWMLRWDVIRNEDIFVGIPELWWLEYDEYEIMKIVTDARKKAMK